MASFSCKYKTAAEIETLDFIECIEILEENGLPYQGTEDIEDLRKTIINHLPKSEEIPVSLTGENIDEKPFSVVGAGMKKNEDSGMEMKFDVKSVSGVETKIDENKDFKKEMKFDVKSVSGVETKVDEKIDSGMEMKFDGKSFSGIETKVVEKIDSGMEMKFDVKSFSGIETKVDENKDFKKEMKFDVKSVSGMETKVDERDSGMEMKFDVKSFSGIETKVVEKIYSRMEMIEVEYSDSDFESKLFENREMEVDPDEISKCELTPEIDVNPFSEMEITQDKNSDSELETKLYGKSSATSSKMEQIFDEQSLFSETKGKSGMMSSKSYHSAENIPKAEFPYLGEQSLFSETKGKSGMMSSKSYHSAENIPKAEFPYLGEQSLFSETKGKSGMMSSKSYHSAENIPKAELPYLGEQSLLSETKVEPETKPFSDLESSVGMKLKSLPYYEMETDLPETKQVSQEELAPQWFVPLLNVDHEQKLYREANVVIENKQVKETKTFGVPLEELVKRAPTGSTVPVFVSKVLDYLIRRAGYSEHLFRKEGQRKRVKKLKNLFDVDGDVDLEKETDIVAVEELFKVFLRELPQPVIPAEVIPALEKPVSDDEQAGGGYHLASALLVLPNANWQMMKFLAQSLPRMVMPGDSLSEIAEAIVPSLAGVLTSQYSNSWRSEVERKSWGSEVESNSWGSEVESNSWGSKVKSNSWGSEVKSNSWESEVERKSWGSEVKSNSWESEVKSNSWGSEVKSNSWESEVKSNSWESEVKSNSWESEVKNMLLAEMELDPEGTEKLQDSEFIELMNTPKRWELVIYYLDPIEICDSLYSKDVFTLREYYSLFKKLKTKEERIEYFRQTIKEKEKGSIFMEEMITFIQNARRTLVMKRILNADDATLKKMLKEQKDSSANIGRDPRNLRWKSSLLPISQTTTSVTEPIDFHQHEKAVSLLGMKDIGKFIKAVQGTDADLPILGTLFQVTDIKLDQLRVNPLLIVSVFGSPEAVEYIHKWNSIKFLWNETLEIKSGVFEGLLDEMKVKRATPLYVATFMKKLLTVQTLIKYADEQNLAYCMNNLDLSTSMERVYMMEIGKRLKEEYSDLKPAVVPGHIKEDDRTWVRAFVVYSRDVMQAKSYIRKGIGQVMLRNPYKVDSESRTVSNNKDPSYEISRYDMERTKQAIESHSKTLWCNHTNLNIISVCSIRSKCKGAILEKNLCVVLYCSTKGVVPLGEEEFPRKLSIGDKDSIDIDVREGYFEFGGYETRSSTFPHDKLKMGCNIGIKTAQPHNSGGTLGLFVKYNNELSFLTCGHVIFDVGQYRKIDFTYDGSNEQIEVVQPASDTSYGSSASCGMVHRAIFNPALPTSIDVAVVTLTDQTRVPAKGRFALDHSFKYIDAGFKELPEYNSGSLVKDIDSMAPSNMVVQFGSETHLTKGSLIVRGAQVRPLSTALGLPSYRDEFSMINQYEVEGIRSGMDFFRLGDSGAAMFMMERTYLHCVGMSIGRTSSGHAVVTPIRAILEALRSDQNRISIAKFKNTLLQQQCSRIKRKYRKMDLKRQRFKCLKKM